MTTFRNLLLIIAIATLAWAAYATTSPPATSSAVVVNTNVANIESANNGTGIPAVAMVNGNVVVNNWNSNLAASNIEANNEALNANATIIDYQTANGSAFVSEPWNHFVTARGAATVKKPNQMTGTATA